MQTMSVVFHSRGLLLTWISGAAGVDIGPAELPAFEAALTGVLIDVGIKAINVQRRLFALARLVQPGDPLFQGGPVQPDAAVVIITAHGAVSVAA